MVYCVESVRKVQHGQDAIGVGLASDVRRQHAIHTALGFIQEIRVGDHVPASKWGSERICKNRGVCDVRIVGLVHANDVPAMDCAFLSKETMPAQSWT